jgi:large subunit ribosomal protein L28
MRTRRVHITLANKWWCSFGTTTTASTATTATGSTIPWYSSTNGGDSTTTTTTTTTSGRSQRTLSTLRSTTTTTQPMVVMRTTTMGRGCCGACDFWNHNNVTTHYSPSYPLLPLFHQWTQQQGGIGSTGSASSSVRFRSNRSRRGLYDGKDIRTGNNVSFSFKATKRTFKPNVFKKRLYSETLQQMICFHVTASTLRSVDKAGGLDQYLLYSKHVTTEGEGYVAKQKILQQLEQQQKQQQRQDQMVPMPEK